MRENKDFSNPKGVFKEKGAVGMPEKKIPSGINEVASIRRSELTSMAPDDVNRSKIYIGKLPAPRKPNPEKDAGK